MENKKFSFKKFLKNLGFLIGILFLLSFVLIISAANLSSSNPSPKSKWQIELVSPTSSEFFDCDSYIRDGNTYILFDTLNIKTNEITIGGNYIIKALKNEEK